MMTSWKLLFQVGAVPVYFGAPNVRQWLPTDLSAIHIDDFADPAVLAEFLLNLHQNDAEYSAYLQHKPTYNKDKYSLITNDNLIQAMTERTWGVSDKDQMSKGNFVEKFECLVCARVAQNREMGAIGKLRVHKLRQLKFTPNQNKVIKHES